MATGAMAKMADARGAAALMTNGATASDPVKLGVKTGTVATTDAKASFALPKAPPGTRGSDMYTVTLTVTPAMAAHWLETRNAVNRPVSQRHVDDLAWDMLEGAWKLTPQGIAFNAAGQLVDGQHRLHAVVLSETSVQMRVTLNYQGDVSDPLDRGYNRRIEHMLSLEDGQAVTTTTVALCGAILTIRGDGVANKGIRGSVEKTRRMLERFANEIRWAESLPRRQVVPNIVRAEWAYAFPVAPDKVEEFALAVTNGIGLEHGTPALLLRRFLETMQGRKHTLAVRTEIASKALRALRAHITGERLIRLSGDQDSVAYFRKHREEKGLPV